MKPSSTPGASHTSPITRALWQSARSTTLHSTGRPRRQRGYTLGLGMLSVAFGVGAIGAMGADWAQQNEQLASLSAQATVYAHISRALGNYVTLYYPQLTDISRYPDQCSSVPYRTGPWTAGAQVNAACAAQLAVVPTRVEAGRAVTDPPDASAPTPTVSVANILQPTLAELQALQLLDKAVPAIPLLPISYRVSTGPAPAAGAAPPQANIYGTLVRRIPVRSGINLETLVFNVQPYDLSRTHLNDLLVFSHGMGAMSGYADAQSTESGANPDYELIATSDAWRRPNPVRRTLINRQGGSGGSSVDTGLPGIVAWINSYDATASLTLQRRDGLLPPTADWSFANHDLVNVGRLEVGDLKTLGRLDVGQNLNVQGTVNALRDMTVSGYASLMRLTVTGPATFNGPVEFQNHVTVASPQGSSAAARVVLGGSVLAPSGVITPSVVTGGMRSATTGTRLGPAVDSGAHCSDENALAQEDGTGRLMICKALSWTYARFDASVIVPPALDASCYPEGSLTLFADGTPALCKDRKWISALVPASEGRPCPVNGVLGAQARAGNVNNLLVCQAGTWTADIYARPMLLEAAPGTACRAEEVNAVARSTASQRAGLLVCTDNGSGATTWQLPFAVHTLQYIDYNEFLQTTFFWQNPDGNAVQGGEIMMPPYGTSSFTLVHYKNSVVQRTAVGDFFRFIGTNPNYYMSGVAFRSIGVTGGWGTGAPCTSQMQVGFMDPIPNLTTSGCGQTWTNPMDNDVTGTHPGFQCQVSGGALNTDVQQFYWNGSGDFRMYFHSSSGAWATCTITMYRIKPRSFMTLK